jgi:hypothetical protein
MTVVMLRGDERARAEVFYYRGLDVTDRTVRAHYEVDGNHFTELVEFEGTGTLEQAAARAIAELWYLVAGLSYYKANAARTLDLGSVPISVAGITLLRACVIDGLGEFAFRNNLTLDDVIITGGVAVTALDQTWNPTRVLTPFGGGIDSVVAVHALSDEIDQSLFIVSPPTGRFEPLEATAHVTGLPITRATRALDPAIVRGDARWFNGHVPVSAMITLLAVLAAVADDRGGVVMSNEHSSSVPNVRWRGRDVNHQWSKSWIAEQLLADAVSERLGPGFVVASLLRDRSELWVAQQFAQLTAYHATFRSCNRAFAQDPARRSATWCGHCDKCLFINLMLAPFVERSTLARVLGVEPLADPDCFDQLRTLVGLGSERKPFECVGDPTECAVAVASLRTSVSWRDETNIVALDSLVTPDETLADLLAPQGVSRVPASWLR